MGKLFKWRSLINSQSLINSASGSKVCFVLKHHNLKIEKHCFWVIASWLGVFVAKIAQAE